MLGILNHGICCGRKSQCLPFPGSQTMELKTCFRHSLVWHTQRDLDSIKLSAGKPDPQDVLLVPASTALLAHTTPAKFVMLSIVH